MAVPEQIPYLEYAANGVATSFAVTFQCNSKNKLKVFINGIEQSPVYWQLSFGNVVFNTPPIDGSVVSIERVTPLKRDITYSSYDNSFRPETVNSDFDVLWHSAQELERKNKNTNQKFNDLLDSIAAGEVAGLSAEILARIAADERLQENIHIEELRAYAAEQNISLAMDVEKVRVNSELANRYTKQESYNRTEVDTTFAAYVGGRKAYQTLAAAQAAQSSLPANTAVEVTNDGVNNGTYQWNGTVLTKSAYDPLTQAKGYTDTSTETLRTTFMVEHTDQGIFFLSADRVPLFYVLNDGSFHLAGDNIDLREHVNNINTSTTNSLLYEFKDINNDTVLYVTADGGLYLTGVGGSVQDQIAALRNESFLTFKINSIYDSESRSVFSANIVKCVDDKAVKTLDIIEPFLNETGKVQRIGAALKLTGNKILYFWGGGVGSPYNGDGEGVKLYKRILTYSDSGTITDKGAKTLFRQTNDPAGIAKHPMLGRTKNGRIVLIWDEREGAYSTTNAYSTMIAFSDDEGMSFTAPAVIPNNPAFTFQIVGSTGTIITLSTGRLVCPMYYTQPQQTMGMMYSDDDGLTWQYGAILHSTEGVLQEPSITFDEDDKIYVSSRSTANNSMKHLSVSTDGGQTLTDLGYQSQLVSPQVASSIYYDFENRLMLHSTPTGSSRNKYKIQMSADKAVNWDIAYQPFADNFYIGYSQIIKLASNTYAVVVEGLQNTATVNSAENMGIFIFNTKEVFLNVNRN